MPDLVKKVFVKVSNVKDSEAEEVKKGISDKETPTDNKSEGIDPPKNRKPIVTTTVKGKDSKGSYTDTNSSQEDDLYKGNPASDKPKHSSNTWYNNLTQSQKDAHNKGVKEREAKESVPATPDVKVPGENSTNRVYDPVAEKKPIVRKWTREEVNQPFGGHTSSGSTTDDKVVESGYAKNKIDISNPSSSKNKYEARDFTDQETKLWERGRLSDSDNPLGKEAKGRQESLDGRTKILADYDAKKAGNKPKISIDNTAQKPIASISLEDLKNGLKKK